MSIANPRIQADAGLGRELDILRTIISSRLTRPNTENPSVGSEDLAEKRSSVHVIGERLANANEQLEKHGVTLSFSYDHDTGAVTVLVKAKDTGEIVMQIPQAPMLFDAKSDSARDDRGMLIRAST